MLISRGFHLRLFKLKPFGLCQPGNNLCLKGGGAESGCTNHNMHKEGLAWQSNVLHNDVASLPNYQITKFSNYLYGMETLPALAPVENLYLIARQAVEGFLIGLHKSPFHGFSVEFAEHRLYNQGDNLKYVDWKVFGRSDKMFVKKFEEETNLRCCLAIDTSSSMNFRGEALSKLEFSCIAAASLSFLIKKQLDACSLALFDDRLYHLTPAKAGVKQQQIIISELERLLKKPVTSRNTDLPKALHELAERLHRRSLVVIFSDVPEDPESSAELLSALQHLKFNKHEVLLFHIVEGHKEMNLDFDNRPYTFEDMETGETIKLNPEEYKNSYRQKLHHYRNFIKNECLKYRIDYVYCNLEDAPATVLSRYLVKRNKMT
jgi:uncharacterized protein (DUF58 family)